jgi:hypothetical protein
MGLVIITLNLARHEPEFVICILFYGAFSVT